MQVVDISSLGSIMPRPGSGATCTGPVTKGCREHTGECQPFHRSVFRDVVLKLQDKTRQPSGLYMNADLTQGLRGDALLLCLIFIIFSESPLVDLFPPVSSCSLQLIPQDQFSRLTYGLKLKR